MPTMVYRPRRGLRLGTSLHLTKRCAHGEVNNKNVVSDDLYRHSASPSTHGQPTRVEVVGDDAIMGNPIISVAIDGVHHHPLGCRRR